MADNDPTLQGGQQNNPRNAALQQIANRVHEQTAPDMADFDEESGQITAREVEAMDETIAQAESGQAGDAPTVAEPSASTAPKMLTIIVDGQPIEVEETRIIEAGKRTLQKDNAADKRLQEAAQLKRYYEQQLTQMQRASQADPEHQAPSHDAPQQQPSAIAIDPATLERYLENKLYARDAQKAAAKFVEDFPEIAGDPHLMAMAARLEQQRLDTATALGESYGDPFEAYRKHGESVTKWLQERTGKPAAGATDKQERKRTITAIPAVNARAPAPTEEKVLTVAEKIEQMRQQRLTGRPVPQRH